MMARAPEGTRRGFTLVEVIVVLAILAVLLAVMVPMGWNLFTSERERVLEEELQAIHVAIVGNPAKGTFGYVGDVGKFPGSLRDLVAAPRDAAGRAVPGWRGPYLDNPRIENGLHLDPLARPYEYFLQALPAGVGNQLAIISRGEDGLSSNTTATPNVAAGYVGPVPTDPAYAAHARNADNVSFPRVTGPEALNVFVSGEVGLNILNFDANPKVNAFVPACPQYYAVTATSVPRRAVEASLPHVPGLRFDLVQGPYAVAITAAGQAAPAVAETVTVLPASTLTRTYNLTGLDSRDTPLMNLRLVNRTGGEIEVYEFDRPLSPRLRADETRVYQVHACAQVATRPRGTSTVVEHFVMPYGPATRQIGASGAAQAATLTVVNEAEQRLRVLDNQVVLGTGPRGDVHDDEGASHRHVKTTTFTALTAGDLVEVRNDKDLTLLASFTLAPGTNTVTVR